MDGLMYSGTRKRSRAEFQYAETNDRNNKPSLGRGREPAMPAADSTVYRILCPANLIGSVIGKGGQVIESLRKETRSKIRVADGAPGTDHERVIVIYSSPVNNKKNDNQNEDAEPTVCPAQDALLRVHSIIVLDHADHNPNKKQRESNAENQEVINARLLVANSQIGSLIGKGGNNIQKMRSDSGAQIRILPRHQLSASTALAMTSSVDELVQISGDAMAVKKALYAVSTFLHKHPSKEQIPYWNNNNNDVLAVHNTQRLLLPLLNNLPQGNGNSMFSYTPVVGFGSHRSGLGRFGSGDGSAWPISNYTRPDLPTVSNFGTSADPNKGPSEEFTIRILCPSDKIGGVIGKGGNTVKNIRKETGASIKIEDAPSTESESDNERVIVVSTTEFVHDRVSPTLEAILQLQGKTSGGSPSSSDKEGIVICTRMLVPSNQIGCLLGKGGNIINEMRKKTRADIRIFPKEDRPKCASKEMELLQIIGEADVARDALIEIVRRLRERVFKDSKDGAYISGRHV